MTDIKQYFIDQEERVSNTYMSASGEPQLQQPTFRSKYKLMYYLIMWKNNLTGINSTVIRLSPK